MATKHNLVDIGVNLLHRQFARDRAAVVARAAACGVHTLVVTGTSVRSSREAAKYAAAAAPSPRIVSTAGCHPHDAKGFKLPGDVEVLASLAAEPHVVAIGECGLDFNRNFSPKEQQVAVFEAQLQLAIRLRMPLFVHEREAGSELLNCIDRAAAAAGVAAGKPFPVPLVVHCFTSSASDLRAYLARGFYIGLTGTLCKKQRGAPIRALVPSIPLDRLLLETDAPFMSPRVAAAVAGCLGKPVAEVEAATTRNALRFFGLEAAMASSAAAPSPAPAPAPAPSAATVAAGGAGGGAGAGAGAATATATATATPTSTATPTATSTAVSASPPPPPPATKAAPVPYIDTHCHFDTVLSRLKLRNVAALLPRCPAGLAGVVCIFCDPAAFAPSLAVYDDMLTGSPLLHGAFGIHPHHAKHWSPAVEGRVRTALAHPKAVALGECGLDFHYNRSPKEDQLRVFELQLKLAVELAKPVVIHIRKAEAEALEIMKRALPKEWRIHVHCYTGNSANARLFLAAFPNLYLGFTGVITYKNASVTRDAVRTVVPLERLLLETDGPNLKPDEAFLLKPEAQAGGKGKGSKRRGRNAVCHPGHIPIVAAAIAAIKGGTTSTEDVLAAAYTNAKTMYGLP